MMKKRFEKFLLEVIIYLLRSRDVNRSPYVSRHFNRQLWGMSERIEAIVMWMDGELEYDAEFDTFRDPKEPSDSPYNVNL